MIRLVTTVALTFLVACTDGESKDRQGQAPDREADPRVISPPLTGVVVEEIVGSAEIRRKKSWSPLRAGEAVGLKEQIRTSQESSVTLSFGDKGRVVLREESSAGVQEISERVARFRLDRGRIGGEVVGDNFRLRIEPRGSNTAAETSAGSVAMYTDGEGLVAIAAEKGIVTIIGKGGDTILQAGYQAVVAKDSAPRVEAIPKSTFLKVAWPAQKRTREAKLSIRGAVQAGSEVTVNGRKAAVQPDGSFVKEVPLKHGDNQIEVEAVDVMGRSTSAASTLNARHRGPKMKVNRQNLWE